MCHLLWCSSITKSLNGFHRPFTETATEDVLRSCSAAHASALSHSNLDIWFCKGLMNLPYSPHLHLQCSDRMINLHQLLKAHPGGLTPRPIRAPTGATGPHTSAPRVAVGEQNKGFPRCPRSHISNNCLVRIFLVPMWQVETLRHSCQKGFLYVKKS